MPELDPLAGPDPASRDVPTANGLVHRLRAAGCVFAEEEAAALRVSAADPRHLEELTRRRVGGEPLEHVVGWVDFGRLRLAVGPGVFVPRQRSLLLARTAAAVLRGRQQSILVEAYAGVAPIACAVVAKLDRVEVHVFDIDSRPLRYAAGNLPPVAGVHHADILDGPPLSLRGRTSLLVAVPPYVPLAAAHLLPREAREHEPAHALFGGRDGLDQVRMFIDTAAPWLAREGRALVELHAGQYAAAAHQATASGFTTRRHDTGDLSTTVLELSPGEQLRR